MPVHLAAGRRDRGRFRRDLRRVEELKHPPGRDEAGLHEGQHAADLAHRLAEEPAELDEGLEAADGHGAGQDLERAHDGHGDVVEVGRQRPSGAARRRTRTGRGRWHGTACRCRPGKLAAAASCRPKALMTSWPVKNSSSWACSSPVLPHCSVKWAWDFLATRTVMRVDTGTETSGDQGQERREPQHHGQRPGEHQQRHDQLVEQLVEGLGDVVDVVRGAAQHVPAVLLVEVAGRQQVQFVLHRGPQPVAQALHGDGGQGALDPAEERRPHVHDGNHQPAAAASSARRRTRRRTRQPRRRWRHRGLSAPPR